MNLSSAPLLAAVLLLTTPSTAPQSARSAGRIRHIVILVQENRSVDNLFNGFPGADTVTSGSAGTAKIALHPVDLATPYDPAHTHRAWTIEYDNGAMDGFARERTDNHSAALPDFAYAYVPKAQVAPYWTLAHEYAFADRMFATNEGPSFPAHLYLAAGNSAIDGRDNLYAMENAKPPKGSKRPGGCDSEQGTTVALIDPSTGDTSAAPVFPCFEHQTIFDLLDAAHVSWRWYQPRLGHGVWFTPDAYRHIRYGSDYAKVSAPNTRILSDVQGGRLAGVSWVIPTAKESDHPGSTDGSGPAWVAQIVDAVGASPYWKDTAIFIVWDDWGGWYDHVAPPRYNAYELGFRVPLIAISPYAKTGYVSHVQHEFGSILKFTEGTFALGSLHTTDARADDLSDMFDFSRAPRTFVPVMASRPSAADANDSRIPDDDGD